MTDTNELRAHLEGLRTILRNDDRLTPADLEHALVLLDRPEAYVYTELRTTWWLDRVAEELRRGVEKFPIGPNTAHGSFAVLKEEVDELWDEVRGNAPGKATGEAVQTAAMAIRYLLEHGTPHSYRSALHLRMVGRGLPLHPDNPPPFPDG